MEAFCFCNKAQVFVSELQNSMKKGLTHLSDAQVNDWIQGWSNLKGLYGDCTF